MPDLGWDLRVSVSSDPKKLFFFNVLSAFFFFHFSCFLRCVGGSADSLPSDYTYIYIYIASMHECNAAVRV